MIGDTFQSKQRRKSQEFDRRVTEIVYDCLDGRKKKAYAYQHETVKKLIIELRDLLDEEVEKRIHHGL